VGQGLGPPPFPLPTPVPDTAHSPAATSDSSAERPGPHHFTTVSFTKVAAITRRFEVSEVAK
jgi:hypothetical protein